MPRIQPRVFLRSGNAALTGTGTVGSGSPVPPPSETGDKVQLAELYANWTYAHSQLYAAWPIAGGCWLDANNVRNGLTPHVVTTVASAGAQAIPFNVKTIVEKLRLTQFSNTGFFLHVIGSGTPPAVWSKNGGAVIPALNIVTDQGTYNPICIEDTYLDASSNSLGALNHFHPPALIKFDLSGVQGTVSTAVLTLYFFTFYTVPITIAVDIIEMPPIYSDPANQGLTIEQGIANTVTSDTDLASHPSVIRYDNFQSDADFSDDYVILNPNSLGTGGHTYVGWPEHNLSALRATSSNQSLIMVAPRYMQPLNSASGPAGASWKRPYGQGSGLGYDELYMRFLVMVDENVNIGMTELGMKLFTLAGRYEWGAYTPGIPTLDQDEMFEIMTWHGPVAVNNPHVYALALYRYDQAHSFQDNPSDGQIVVASNFYLRAGRKHSIELYLKLNTITGSPQTVNSDGIEKLWLDGALASSRTGLRQRNLAHVQIQSAPQAQIYHGGIGRPSAPISYEVTGTCIATSYIGPPKLAIPAWVPPAGTYAEFTLNTPLAARPSTLPDANDVSRIMRNWCGGVHIADYDDGEYGGVAYHGGGEHGSGSRDSCGVLMLNVKQRIYEYRCIAPRAYTQSSGFTSDPNPTTLWGEHIDPLETGPIGSPGAPHTYNCLVEMPASWGGGPKGSMVRCGNTAGGSTQRALNGEAQSLAANAYNCVHKFDLSYTQGGYTRLTPATGSIRYGLPVDWGGNYGGACIDRIREGWWVKAGTQGSSRLIFISKAGVITETSLSFGSPYPHIHHLTNDGQDLLAIFIISNPANYFYLVNAAAPGSNPLSRTTSGTIPASSSTTVTVADLGPRWSDLMGCFYCLDHTLSTPTLYYLTPSNPANLLGSTWAWTSEVITSHDGTNWTPTVYETDGASYNGAYGKLVEIPQLRSLVWTRGAFNKGLLVRPSALA